MEHSRKQRLHAVIHGKVQGVGFRFHIAQQIRLHARSVEGWVRRLGDDRLELLVEGTQEDLDHLIEVMNIGPVGSEVRLVETDFTEAQDNLHGFNAWPDVE